MATTAAVWQQILALDARYNVHRSTNNNQFRTQYIRRRSQLLREAAKNKTNADPTLRKEYLRLRRTLLSRKYGPISEASSIRSSSARGSVSYLDRTGSSLDVSVIGEEKTDGTQTIVPSKQANASRAMVGDKSVGENYAFAGMHHVFDGNCGKPVSTVKFANDEKHTLAYASMDGTVSICKLDPPDAKVSVVLDGHSDGVTDFAWSLSNDMILTCSLDSTIRLWQTKNGTCIRVIKSTLLGMVECRLNCCLFQPVNNNMAVCGNGHGQIAVVNISTGKSSKGGSGKVSGSVLSMTFDSSGKVLWVGNDKGYITSFTFDLASGKLRKAHQMSLVKDGMITSIQARSWINREARDPSVLVNASKNVLCLYRVTDDRGLLQLRKSFRVKHTTHMIRSVFCPLISFRQGACVVTANENMNVTFFDIERNERPCVNSLQGHSSPVLDISFNYNESLLCSCIVIVWKREL